MRLVPPGVTYLFSRARSADIAYPRTVAVRAVRLYQRDRWRWSVRRRRRSVDDIPIDRPIFVLGLQGGGTTLVTRCLLRHPAVVSMGGNSSFWVATDELGFVRNRMARLPRTLWSAQGRTDVDGSQFGSNHDSAYASHDLFPHYRNTADDATPEDAAVFKRVIREHIDVYARDPQNARFVDKTHTYSLKVPYLEALLDGCDPYFVLVVRNPYTMCFRAVRRKPPQWIRAPAYEEQLRIAAQHWRASYCTALEDGARSPRFGAVRFEDFVRDPAAVVEAICAFTGLAYDPDLVPDPAHQRPFGTLPSDTKWYPLLDDPWRARVPDADAALIDAECGALARALGYGRDVDFEPQVQMLAPARNAEAAPAG